MYIKVNEYEQVRYVCLPTLHAHYDQYVNISESRTKISANRELRHSSNQYGRLALFPPYLLRHRPRRLGLRPYHEIFLGPCTYLAFARAATIFSDKSVSFFMPYAHAAASTHSGKRKRHSYMRLCVRSLALGDSFSIPL